MKYNFMGLTPGMRVRVVYCEDWPDFAGHTGVIWNMWGWWMMKLLGLPYPIEVEFDKPVEVNHGQIAFKTYCFEPEQLARTR